MIEIPNYTIESELGRGGMATVYLAVQDMLSRHVALKVMLPDMARDENFRKSFLSEGKIIANLEHTNIVRVHDVGVIDDSILYMAMENLAGGTLKERLIDRSLSYAESLRILEQVAAGLAYAHDKGYIHRDVKPGNILFRDNGTAVLTDFGIAKLQDTSGELTRMGYTMGTVQYMSPEQAVTTDLDKRSDIYSLGLVFYEMLTGQKAFKAESTIQAIHQHTTVAPPELPEKYGFLQETIDKVLAKEPVDRYQTIDEFIDAVKAAADVDKTVVRKISDYNDLDKTQILKPNTKTANKSRTGLVISILGGLSLIGALLFAAMKNPDLMPWSEKNDNQEISKQEIPVEKVKITKENETPVIKRESEDLTLKLARATEIKKVEEEILEKQKKKEDQAEIKKQEEQQRLTEAKKQEELKRLTETKILEEKRLEKEQEEQRLAEAKIREEERLAEAKKQEDQQRLAEMKKREEKRLAGTKKQEEQQRLAGMRKREEKRLAEAKRQEEQQRLTEAKTREEKRLAEAKRQEEQQRLAEAKMREEAKKQEEQQRLTEAKTREEKRLAEAKRQEEQQRLTEAKKREEKRLVEAKKQEKKRLAKAEKQKEQKRLAVAKKAAAKKKLMARKKAEEKKRKIAALKAKKVADANRRKQQLARSKAHIRVSATLNGRPLKTSFVLIKNGKRVQTISGRANANFDVPPGRYTLKAQYGGQVGNAAVNVGAFETAIQQFAFKTSAPARAPVPPTRDALDPKWEHEHVLPSLSQ